MVSIWAQTEGTNDLVIEKLGAKAFQASNGLARGSCAWVSQDTHPREDNLPSYSNCTSIWGLIVFTCSESIDSLLFLVDRKSLARLDLSQVLSVELIVMLSETSTSRQTSGGLPSSASWFRISATLGRCQCVLEVLSLQKFDYGIVLIYCVSDIFTYLEYVCTNRLWVSGKKGLCLFALRAPTLKQCIFQSRYLANSFVFR